MSAEVASLPSWKQELIERKRRQEIEKPLDQNHMGYKGDTNPPSWKRDLARKQQQQSTYQSNGLNKNHNNRYSTPAGHTDETSDVPDERILPITQNPILLLDIEKKHHSGSSAIEVEIPRGDPSDRRSLSPAVGNEAPSRSPNLCPRDDTEEVFNEIVAQGGLKYGRGFVHRLLKRFSGLSGKEDNLKSSNTNGLVTVKSPRRSRSSGDMLREEANASEVMNGSDEVTRSCEDLLQEGKTSPQGLKDSAKHYGSVPNGLSNLQLSVSGTEQVEDSAMTEDDKPQENMVSNVRSIFEKFDGSKPSGRSASAQRVPPGGNSRRSASPAATATRNTVVNNAQNKAQSETVVNRATASSTPTVDHSDGKPIVNNVQPIKASLPTSSTAENKSAQILGARKDNRPTNQINTTRSNNELPKSSQNKTVENTNVSSTPTSIESTVQSSSVKESDSNNASNKPVVTQQTNSHDSIYKNSAKITYKANNSDVISPSINRNNTSASQVTNKPDSYNNKLDQKPISNNTTNTTINKPTAISQLPTDSRTPTVEDSLNGNSTQSSAPEEKSYNIPKSTSSSINQVLDNDPAKKSGASRPGKLVIRPASNLVASKTKSEFLGLTKYNDVKKGEFAPPSARPLPPVGTESDDEEEEDVAKIEFIGGAIKLGRSLLSKTKNCSKLKIDFDENTSVFEYPSEQSLMDGTPPQPGDCDYDQPSGSEDIEDHEFSSTGLKSVPGITGSSSLSSYQSRTQINYQFGMYDSMEEMTQQKTQETTSAKAESPPPVNYSGTGSSDLLF